MNFVITLLFVLIKRLALLVTISAISMVSSSLVTFSDKPSATTFAATLFMLLCAPSMANSVTKSTEPPFSEYFYLAYLGHHF